MGSTQARLSFQAAGIHDVVQHDYQFVTTALCLLKELAALFGWQHLIVLGQQFEIALYGSQRSAEFVRGRNHELVFELIQVLQAMVCGKLLLVKLRVVECDGCLLRKILYQGKIADRECVFFIRGWGY